MLDYLFTAAAEDEPDVPQRAIGGLGGWIACFPKARLAGQAFAGGVNDMGDIECHHALIEAYEMGKASSLPPGRESSVY